MPVDVWEWLSLIDHDGPFLSKAALKSFYPSGLPRPAIDDTSTVFADEFVRWSAAWSASPEVYDAARDRWVEVVLRRLLDWSDDLHLSPAGLTAESPNGAVTVTPWAALSGEGKPEALVTVVDRTDDLRSTGADGWSANTIDRMAVMLRETGVTIGIVTDGRWWALVSAAKDVTTASGVWDALLWREERPSRDAFLALASFTSIAGGAPEKRLPLVFAKSVASAEEITEALGDQVRRAVELVLQSMSDTHLRALVQGEPSPLPENPKAVYEGAVTVLMRIVFLLFAEERGLLPEHDLYRSSYAIARIREQLQRDATATSVEALDHSWETWHRLLAASNAVFGGASFQDMRMPAYGGSLFDPARFPWLHATDPQGRLRVKLSDRAMFAVLRAVQTIEDGAMQLSFRDLDVEQIGYVYEGLLGYSADYVTTVTVGLEGRKNGFEPEIALTDLEATWEAADSPADFAERVLKHLKKTQEQSKPPTAKQITKALAAIDPAAAADARTRLRHALLGDDDLAARLVPFHGLIRNDLRGFPYVVPAGGLVMTESAQRATTGTHYTPRSLAEGVVLHALEPLVYSPGPLEVENRSQWKLKSSAELLDLKVADIAVGSGAFLVAAARYLADRLIEARANEGLDVSGESDLRRWAVREIVARCLYGADINGMAVEMCKLSLWLISMDPGKPFSFVDDRVFHGNSLLGITTEEQLKAQHIYPNRRHGREQLRWFDVDRDLDDAARIRRELASGQVDDADRMRSTKAKHALLAQAEHVTAKLRDVADGIVAAGLTEHGTRNNRIDEAYDDLTDALSAAYPTDSSTRSDRTRLDHIVERGLKTSVGARWKPLHWIVEAPDVIRGRGGFDAIIGNPPFRGGQKISDDSGINYRDWLVEVVGGGIRGSADLVAYFYLRAAGLVRSEGGVVGLIGTNTLAQGDTREVGLKQILASGMTIYRAIQSAPWPGRATVHYAVAWLTHSKVAAAVNSDGIYVEHIGALLEPSPTTGDTAAQLRANEAQVFIGSYVLGHGFVLTAAEAHAFIDADQRNADVVLPYVGGEDLSSRPDMSASRWIINFRNMTSAQAEKYRLPYERVRDLVQPARAHLLGRNPTGTDRARNWWKYGRRADALYERLESLEYAFAITLTCNALAPVRVATNQVIDQTAPVFATDDHGFFAIVSSSIHRLWVLQHGSTFGDGARYSLKEGFGTFPFPPTNDVLRDLGKRLDRQRSEVMLRHDLGLTDLYNQINSPAVNDGDTCALRSLHDEIDRAVADAYGWTDVPLEHGFHTYRQSERWTISPAARAEILARLLKENRLRAKLEAESAPPKKSKRGKSVEESAAPEGAMF